MLSTINFTSTSAYKALQLDQSRLASTTIAQLFKEDAARQEKYSQTFQSIFFDYSKNLILKNTLELLLDFAKVKF